MRVLKIIGITILIAAGVAALYYSIVMLNFMVFTESN
jgi:hypothetical protein